MQRVSECARRVLKEGTYELIEYSNISLTIFVLPLRVMDCLVRVLVAIACCFSGGRVVARGCVYLLLPEIE